MRTMKSAVGLIAAAVPVLYCGGLLLYFSRVGGSFGGLVDGALGPTMVGLGALGLLFLIPLVLQDPPARRPARRARIGQRRPRGESAAGRTRRFRSRRGDRPLSGPAAPGRAPRAAGR